MEAIRRIIEDMVAAGNLDGACGFAEDWLIDHPDDPMGFFLAAECRARAGDLVGAMHLIGHGRNLGGQFPPDFAAPFNNAWIVAPISFGYSEILCRPSAYLGRWTGGAPSRVQTEAIHALLDLHWQAWCDGDIAPPRRAGVFAGITPKPPARPVRLLVAMPRYIRCQPDYVDNDVALNFAASARAFGLETRVFECDALMDQRTDTPYAPEDRARARAELDAVLAEFRPDLMVIDGNGVAGEPDGIITPAEWNDLRRRHGVKILTFIPDCYDLPDHPKGIGKLSHWEACSDLVNILHPYGYDYVVSPRRDKVLVTPSLPFEPSLFAGQARERDLAYSLISSNSRFRATLINAARGSGLIGVGLVHNRTRAEAPDYPTYVEAIIRAKTSINNGRVYDNAYIITGRTCEAILGGSVLLEECATPFDDYYVPFVHYLPYSNYHELILLIQVLDGDESRRRRITDAARAFWDGHYSSGHYWTAILDRLGVG